MGRTLRHFRAEHLRLFNRTKGRFTLVKVHEGVYVEGRPGTMTGRIIHYSYRDLSHHLEKLNTYTTRAAEENNAKGKSYFKGWAAFKFPLTFFIFYIIRLGILDGYPGFLWSFFAAVYSSVKVAKTIELKQKK
jgi:hypothetical protein